MSGRRFPEAAFLAALLAPVVVVLVGFRIVPLGSALSLARAPELRSLAAIWGSIVLLVLTELPFIALAGFALPPVLSRSGRWEGALIAVLLAPLVLPGSVLAAAIMSIFGVAAAPAGSSSPGAAAIVVAVDASGYGGAAALLSLLVGRRLGGSPAHPGRLRPHGVAVMLVLLARLALLLAGNIDAVTTVSSAVLEPAVPDPYLALWPRDGLWPGTPGGASAAWLLHLALGLALVPPLALCGRRLLRMLPPAGERGTHAPAGSPSIPALAASVLWIGAIAAILAVLVVRPLVGLPEAFAELSVRMRGLSIGIAFLRFGVCTAAAALLSVFCTVAAAYPLARGGPGGRTAYACFLLALLAIPSAGVPDYLVLGGYGMVNTIYPFLLRGIVPVGASFLLALLRRTAPAAPAHPVDRAEPYAFFYGFLAPVRSDLAALGLVLMAKSWGDVGVVGIFMTASASALSPVASFRALAASSTTIDGAVLLAALVVSLPPLLVLPVLPRLLGVGGKAARPRGRPGQPG